MEYDPPEWPESVGFPEEWHDRASELAHAAYDDPGWEPPADTPFVDAGAGRTVLDISAVTSVPCVLRVAHTPGGRLETTNELGRDTYPDALVPYLAPVYAHGDGGLWSVQPKCEHFPLGVSIPEFEFLRALAHEHGVYSDEVCAVNAGLWNGAPALYDYGGIHC
jgi:hypothetical protein